MATKKKDDATSKIVSALSDDTMRQRLIGAVSDHALEQPLATWLDVEAAVEIVVDALVPANVAAGTERHVVPFRSRLREHFETTGETAADLMPDDFPERIVAIFSSSRLPKASWAQGAIDRAKLRTLFAPVVQDILLGFTRKLPLPGLAGDASESASSSKRGGIGARLRKSAGSFVDAGKGVLGSLGADLERRIQSVASDFSQQAMSDARDKIKARLRSDEGRQLLEEMRRDLLDRVLKTPLVEIIDDLERGPVEELLALGPDFVDHNRQLETFRAFIRDELNALLALEGERSVRDLLDEAGLLDALRTQALARADQPVADFARSKAFGDWLNDALKG